MVGSRLHQGIVGAALLIALAGGVRAAPPERPPSSSAKVPLVSYTVQPGDSCGHIAKRLYGDPHRVDLIHDHNDLGPLPHRLRPGLVLQLPVNATSGMKEPDARLTFVRNQVEAYTPDYHRGQKNEALAQGNRVGTLAASSAEISFVNETRMQLGEHSMVVIFGEGAQDALPHRRAAGNEEATLLRGTLRAHLLELTGPAAASKPIAVTTPAGRIELPARGSEIHVDVDPQHTTRLSVLRGRSRLAAAGRKVEVPQGFGCRADQGRAPTTPHPLPAAPVWTVTLPPVLLGHGAPPTARLSYRAGVGPPAAQWRRQVARDASFNDLVEDRRVPAAELSWALPALPDGELFIRISAIDGDRFEGLASPVLKTHAALVQLEPGGPSGPATVRFPGGLLCGLDGAPLQTVAQAALTPAHDHKLRCALRLDAPSAEAAELTIPAAESGVVLAIPEHGQTRWTATSGERDFAFRLTDQAGAPLSIPAQDVELRAAAGVSVAPLLPGGRGEFRTHLSWPSAVGDLGLLVQLRGVQLAAIPLQPDPREYEPPPPALPAATPLPPTPAALAPTPREPRIWLEVAGAGLALFGSSGYGFGGGIELGPRIRLPFGAIGVSLRAAVEPHLQPEPAPLLLNLGGALTYVLARPSWRVSPYIGLWGQALLARPAAQPDGAAPLLPSRAAALGGLVGVQLRLWSGGLFTELGYRGALAQSGSATVPAPFFDTAFVLLGYRLTTN